MPWRSARTCLPLMVMTSMWKNLTSGTGPPLSFSRTVLRVRALDLVAIVIAVHRLALGVARRAVVAAHLDVEAAGLCVELHPVHRRRTAHEIELVFGVVEHDDVADDVAVVAQGSELLGAVGHATLEGIARQVVQHLEGVGPGHQQFRHVVRLVEQDGRIAPRLLLVAPVAELRRHLRIDVRPDPRIPQQINGTLRGL